MGQKAKNSGKKASKVCDKAASVKSVKHNGKKGLIIRTPITIDGVNIFDAGDIVHLTGKIPSRSKSGSRTFGLVGWMSTNMLS